MRLFSCDYCGHVVHFDNRSCINCGHRLGFVPEKLTMCTLEPSSGGAWPIVGKTNPARFLCANASIDVCNWLVDPANGNAYCVACRHNRLVPNTNLLEGIDRFRRINQAQRHLFYSLLRWSIPHPDRNEDPAGGLVFDFVEDTIAADGSIVAAMTGHDEGAISIRAAEADDVTRELARSYMHEHYRTLLGHFRHETGHFVWNKLIRDRGAFEEFRAVFGDEREDYDAALQRHYEAGPTPGWTESFVSAYASAHPWEDFAECFAHLLHAVDTLETARAFGMVIDPHGYKELAADVNFDPYNAPSAQQLMDAWIPLSVAINAIQRSMGQPDTYPFILSPPVVAKLDFINKLMTDEAKANSSDM